MQVYAKAQTSTRILPLLLLHILLMRTKMKSGLCTQGTILVAMTGYVDAGSMKEGGGGAGVEVETAH